MKKLIPILVFIITLFGCSTLTGEEIGRLEINTVSTEGNLIIKETVLDLKKGETIAIWSEMDMKYEGEINLMFKIQVFKNEKELGVFEIDPTDKKITIGEIKTSVMGKTNWSFSGKNTQFTIKDDGEYTFKGILVASNNPSLEIEKAEIILKK